MKGSPIKGNIECRVCGSEVFSKSVCDRVIVEGLNKLWQLTTGDTDICIAVLDGPVDIKHPCLDGAHLSNVDIIVSGELEY